MRTLAGRSSRIAFLALALPGVARSGDGLDPMAGTLARDEPQAVYSPDPADPWNRVFHALFTRKVRARVTGEFRGAAPLVSTKVPGIEREVSGGFFERIEGGDRAIEPLDPFASSFGSKLALDVLDGKGFERLRGALADALDDRRPRSTLARALMQADVWAAHDVVHASGHEAAEQAARRDVLLDLLARLVKKLALTPREIEGLPRNFEEARLPLRLLEKGGPWIEVEFLPDRGHEAFSNLRRVTRVFLKPTRKPDDPIRWLEEMQESGGKPSTLDAAALAIQLLLIDDAGKVVPSTLTYEVQVRTFPRDERGAPGQTGLFVAELSRERLLAGDRGGLKSAEGPEIAYLPTHGGNDYGFASRVKEREPESIEAVLGPLRMRCQACHGTDVARIQSASVHLHGPPDFRTFDPSGDRRARELSARKMDRKDYKALMDRWGR